jgi:hypothetical protein
MKLFNFKLIKTEGDGFDKIFYAEVEVQTGFLFWKKTEKREICKRYTQPFWSFKDTGKFCPSVQAEELARAYSYQNNVSF